MELFRNPMVFKRRKTEEDSIKIAVVPGTDGAGASFVCGMEASLCKENACIAELGKPYFYRALAMEKRFAGKKVFFYEDEEGALSPSDIKNELFGINWLVRRPDAGPCEYMKLLKILKFSPPGKVFLDYSGVPKDMVLESISEADRILVVVDPLPVKLIEASAYLEKLHLMYPSAELVVNKMNRGVYKNELKRFFGNWSSREIPYYDPCIIYKAEFNCCLPDFTQ